MAALVRVAPEAPQRLAGPDPTDAPPPRASGAVAQTRSVELPASAAGRPTAERACPAAAAEPAAAALAGAASPAVVAVATAAPDPGPPRPPQPTRPARPADRCVRAVRSWIGHLHIGQLLCWQLALLAPVAAADRPMSTFVAVCVAAGLLLAATTIRVRGRWLYEWAALGTAFGVRSTVRRRRTGEALAVLAPRTAIRPLRIGDTDAAALVHPDHVSAVLVTHTDDALPDVSSLLPTDREIDYVAQLVVRYAPGEPRRAWIVLRARPDAQWPDVAADVANATRRLQRRLVRQGTPCTPAAAGDLAAAVELLAATTGPATVRERWRECRTGDVRHITATVPGVPAQLPTGTVTVCSAASRTRERTLVRVTGNDLGSLAALPGAQLLDGRQLAGLRACGLAGSALDIR